MDACVGSQGPAVLLNATPIWEGMKDLKNKGVRLRWITDITKENLDYCKELMRILTMDYWFIY
jgi:hypothetical protein